MEWFVWCGAVVSLVGLFGLAWCIYRVAAARRKGLTDDELREAVRRVVPINMGALGLSVIGLMMVTVGVFLA